MIIPPKNYSDAELFLTRIIIPRHSHPVNHLDHTFVNHEIHEIHENVLSCEWDLAGG